MANVVLIIMMIVFFVFGYFVAARFDKYMDELYSVSLSQHTAEKETQVLLTTGKCSYEIAAGIDGFLSIHGQNAAIVIISEDSELYAQFASQVGSDALNSL